MTSRCTDDKLAVELRLRAAGFVPFAATDSELDAVLDAGVPAFEVRERIAAGVRAVTDGVDPEYYWRPREPRNLRVTLSYEPAPYTREERRSYWSTWGSDGGVQLRLSGRRKVLWTAPWVELLLDLRASNRVAQGELLDALHRGAGDREWADALLAVSSVAGRAEAVVEFARTALC